MLKKIINSKSGDVLFLSDVNSNFKIGSDLGFGNRNSVKAVVVDKSDDSISVRLIHQDKDGIKYM